MRHTFAFLFILVLLFACSKEEPSVQGCTNSAASNYNPNANVDDGSCTITGCTDPAASNYNPNANVDDGSCTIAGCTDPASSNYNPNANVDDGSCTITGCTDQSSLNYDSAAVDDDGSCEYTQFIGSLTTSGSPLALFPDENGVVLSASANSSISIFASFETKQGTSVEGSKFLEFRQVANSNFSTMRSISSEKRRNILYYFDSDNNEIHQYFRWQGQEYYFINSVFSINSNTGSSVEYRDQRILAMFEGDSDTGENNQFMIISVFVPSTGFTEYHLYLHLRNQDGTQNAPWVHVRKIDTSTQLAYDMVRTGVPVHNASDRVFFISGGNKMAVFNGTDFSELPISATQGDGFIPGRRLIGNALTEVIYRYKYLASSQSYQLSYYNDNEESWFELNETYSFNGQQVRFQISNSISDDLYKNRIFAIDNANNSWVFSPK